MARAAGWPALPSLRVVVTTVLAQGGRRGAQSDSADLGTRAEPKTEIEAEAPDTGRHTEATLGERQDLVSQRLGGPGGRGLLSEDPSLPGRCPRGKGGAHTALTPAGECVTGRILSLTKGKYLALWSAGVHSVNIWSASLPGSSPAGLSFSPGPRLLPPGTENILPSQGAGRAPPNPTPRLPRLAPISQPCSPHTAKWPEDRENGVPAEDRTSCLGVTHRGDQREGVAP